MAKNQQSSASLGDLCPLAVNSSSFPDLLGRRTGSTAKNKLGTLLSSETYQYDLRSQLTGYTGPTGTIGYGYDPAGNLAGAKSSTPGGYDIFYDYDTQNRITMVHRGQQGIDPTATQLAAYNYDANGNLNGTGYANGIQHAYTYNPQNRLTNLAVNHLSTPSSTLQALQSYAYTLNKNGHRTQITELSGRVITNTFDKLHRLTREAITGSAPVSGASTGILPGVLSYSYDFVGNRTSRTTTGPIATIIPSQTQSFTVNDRLTTDTYDANGNTLVSPSSSPLPPPNSSVSDTYSFDNRLIRRTTPDGKTIDLTYNPDGHRLSKFITQNALTQRLVHYLTEANNPTGYAQVIEEKEPLDIASPLRKVNLYGHDLICSVGLQPSSSSSSPLPPPASLLYYSYDGLGSVRSISNATGDLQETYDYDAYGTLIGLNKRNPATGLLESLNTENFNLATSSYLFTGEQYDSDLGMYFLRARYLNTNTRRFHTQDTYEGQNGEPLTLHKYLYAHGNPVSYADPSGRFILSNFVYGKKAHDEIGKHFLDEERSGGLYDRSIDNVLKSVGHPGGAVGGRMRPDLVDTGTAEVWEIKSILSASTAFVQLDTYIALLTFQDPRKRFYTPGITYLPPPIIDVGNNKRALVWIAAPGVITYWILDPVELGLYAAGALTVAGLQQLTTLVTANAILAGF